MKLATYLNGEATEHPPLLIVHGLYGSAKNWGAFAKALSDDRQVISVDMRNHGHSPHLPTHGYEEMAEDLATVLNGTQADVLGHSMGGKAAMRLALTYPMLVRRLIVADIAPVAYGHSQVQYIHAMRALDLSAIETRRDADASLAAHIDDKGLRAFLLQSLDRTKRRWRLNLDVLEAEMPRILGWPETAGNFEGPAIFLSGALSDYVTNAHRPKIQALFPKARFAKIPGAGHWLHADRPDATLANLQAILA